MITSNLTEAYQERYLSYLTSKYEHLWHICTQGKKVFYLISFETIKNLFELDITSIKDHNNDSVERVCDLKGSVLTVEQLKVIGFKYNLRWKKSYVDLLVAHNICRYNSYLTDSLVLLADDMYDARQLHKEFYEAIHSYYNEKIADRILDENMNVEIYDQSKIGICYKSLMDYLHYGGPKPDLMIKFTIDDFAKKAKLSVDDYDCNFTEMSYNFKINNIVFE